MNKYKFSDGFTVRASCSNEAKETHKVLANSMDIVQSAISIQSSSDSFAKIVLSLVKTLKNLGKKKKCAWRVTDIETTPIVLKYQVSVVNNEDEERTYIVEMDNGLLSKPIISKISNGKLEKIGSAVSDIESFVK